jgi:acyl-CoA thioesterase
MSVFSQAMQLDEASSSFVFPEESAIWGVNGGYLAAAALELAKRHTSHARPLSLACDFLKSVKPGPSDGAAQVLKSGRTSDLIDVSLSQGGKLCLTARVWAGSPPAGPEHRPIAPAVPAPSELPTIEDVRGPDAEPLLPFWNIFEQRIVPNEVISRKPGQVRDLRWFRYKDDYQEADAFHQSARWLPLIDVLGMHAYRETYGYKYVTTLLPTIQLSVHFFGLSSDPWVLCDAWGDVAGDGVLSTRVAVWSRQGVLLAQGIAQAVAQPGSGALVYN